MRTFCLFILLRVVATGAEGPSAGDWRILAGRMVDAQSGEPIVGASLVVSWYDEKALPKKDPPEKTRRTYRTGPQGQFEVRIPPTGSVDILDGSAWGSAIADIGEQFEGKFQFFGRTVTSWRKVAPRTYRMDGMEVRLGRTDITRIYSGRVVDGVTGKPLAGIEVASACQGNYVSECQDARPVFTDGEGRFALTTGKTDFLDRIDGYRLHMDLLQMADGAGHPIFVAHDQQAEGRIEETQWKQVSEGVYRMDGIQAHITAMPRITGVVVDGQQRPVPWVRVFARATGFLKGEPRPGDVTEASYGTDADGAFSMTLSPGEYQIRVDTCQQYTEQDCAGPIAPVYYPGDVTDPARAGRIQLHSGTREEIRVQLRPIATYTVKGTMRFPAPDPNREIKVSIAYQPKIEWPDPVILGSEDIPAKDGVFQFPKVAPGKYRLTANYFRWISDSDTSRRGVGHHTMVQTIEVTDHDLEGADFVFRPPLQVKVRVRTEDGRPAGGAHPDVSLRGPVGSERWVDMPLGPDGTAESYDVMRGDYLVSLMTGNTNYYCKRFLVNGVEQTTPYLDLTNPDGVVELEFIVSKTQARLGGTVTDLAKGAPVSGDVVCKITAEAPNGPWEMSWASTFTAAQGRFRSSEKDAGPLPLVPGDYRIACSDVGATMPPVVSGPGADGRNIELPTSLLLRFLIIGMNETSGHPNRLRVPEDYSREVKLIAGPLE